jgi:hypothetical protein
MIRSNLTGSEGWNGISLVFMRENIKMGRGLVLGKSSTLMALFKRATFSMVSMTVL